LNLRATANVRDEQASDLKLASHHIESDWIGLGHCRRSSRRTASSRPA